MNTQNEAILNHLKNIGPLTPLEALNLYGCFRLGARVWDLEQMGYTIKTQMVKNGGKRYAQYSLKKVEIKQEITGQLSFA